MNITEQNIEGTQQVRVTNSIRIRHLDLVITSDDQCRVTPCIEPDDRYTIPYVNAEEQYSPPLSKNRVLRSLHANDESSRSC